MELEWMAKHRSLVESIIKFGNAYSNAYRSQRDFGTGIEFSASQIQTLEYILESEDKDEKMSKMAKRLGVTTSAFSKNVKILIEKGLLEKYRYTDNQKNIYLKATKKGRNVYIAYTKFVKEACFDEMFQIADQISIEEVRKFEDILDIFTEALIWYKTNKPEPRVLVKITDNDTH